MNTAMNTSTSTNNNMSNMHMNSINNSNSSNKSNRRDVSIPDLLSFDSWDYDSSMISATSSFTTDTSLAPSHDENAPRHRRHHSSTSLKSSLTVPVFATDDIHIQVSGSSFLLNPTVFRQLEKLPWSLVNNTNDDNNVVYSLGTSPDLFEIILNYVLFESLPSLKLLSKSDIEELDPMVIITGLQGLQNHLEKKDLKNKLMLGRSFRRSQSAVVPTLQLHQELDRHMSAIHMNNGSGNNNGTNDNNKVNNELLRRQISAPVLGTSTTHETLHMNANNNSNSNNNNLKGMASRLVRAVSRRQQNQQVHKLTHAQCVASDLVD